MNRSAEPVTPRIRECLDQIHGKEPVLHAFREIHTDSAIQQANLLDQLPSGQRGFLHGLPFALKEVFDAEGALCEWGSEIYQGRRPRSDCEVVKRLRSAGAVLVGITTSSEFALSTPPPTTNPHDVERTPGASSSGSAAAVGAGLVPFAIGSQTIGSCIRPAAYCGCYGFKPTVGSISLSGVMPLAETLDTCGLFGSSLEVIMDVFRVLSSNAQDTDIVDHQTSKPYNVSVVSPWFDEPVSDSTARCVSNAAAAFEQRGIAISHTDISVLAGDEEHCLMTILCHEFAAFHQKQLGNSGGLFSKRIGEFTARGLNTSESDYQEALYRRDDMIAEFAKLVPEDRILLTCATLDIAPYQHEGTGSRAPQRLWTLLGLPCISIPTGFSDGLPQAVQLVAGSGREADLFAAAQSLVAGI